MRACGYQPSTKVADTGRMWTKGLWDGCPWDQIEAKQREGWVFFDDFVNAPNLSADADDDKYASYIDSGDTIKQVAGAGFYHGELAIVTDTTDNDEAWIQTGGNVGGMAVFRKIATGVPHSVWFEARFKKSSTTTGNIFVGFAEPGLAAVDTITDAGALADNNFFGFQVLEADADEINWVYKADGQTAQQAIDALHVVVADTYVKLGFRYDYKGPAAQQIKCMKNGVWQSTYITKANIEAATFPENDDLALLAGVKNSTAAANTLTLDWWRAALLVNA